MQKVISEFVGTAILAAVVVGSGIMAETLSKDVGLQLLINASATGAALWLLITTLGPVSGAQFNPVVTAIARYRKEISVRDSLFFIFAQVVGAVVGTIIANVFFEHPSIEISTKSRDGANLLLSEVIATAGLIFVIYQMTTIKKGRYTATGVALWIFSAYFFTSSTSFANPAISIGRMFSNTFAGIAPHSALNFFPFQLIGAIIGYFFYVFLNSPHKAKGNKS